MMQMLFTFFLLISACYSSQTKDINIERDATLDPWGQQHRKKIVEAS